MAACPEFEPLILDRAAGELDAAGEARLTAHLTHCEACRADDAATREVLELAALPPSPPAERPTPGWLAGSVRAKLRQADQRRTWLRRGLTALVAAAAVLLVMVPRAPHPPLSPAPAAFDSAVDDVESWALEDPFSDALADADSLEADDDADGLAAEPPETEADLFLPSGE